MYRRTTIERLIAIAKRTNRVRCCVLYEEVASS